MTFVANTILALLILGVLLPIILLVANHFMLFEVSDSKINLCWVSLVGCLGIGVLLFMLHDDPTLADRLAETDIETQTVSVQETIIEISSDGDTTVKHITRTESKPKSSSNNPHIYIPIFIP